MRQRGRSRSKFQSLTLPMRTTMWRETKKLSCNHFWQRSKSLTEPVSPFAQAFAWVKDSCLNEIFWLFQILTRSSTKSRLWLETSKAAVPTPVFSWLSLDPMGTLRRCSWKKMETGTITLSFLLVTSGVITDSSIKSRSTWGFDYAPTETQR